MPRAGPLGRKVSFDLGQPGSSRSRRTASASRRAGDIVPPADTFGPFGRAERLNWLAKKRFTNTTSQPRTASRS